VDELILLLSSTVFAARPDNGGGLFSFDDADVLSHVDGPEGLVRVHYSIDGPNVTRLDDDDKSGFPDFAEEVAATAEDVLDFYSALGFFAPLSESEMGLGELGGSDALDFYLVDFGGSADGQFSVDSCGGGVCSGYMIIENDFTGYGYGSLSEAIAVLTSHELFHGVQYAYSDSQPVWLSEGTAVWAEHQYDPSVDDFYWFCGEYLEDPGRSIDSPPAGSVTSFSYGTALFFQFLTERLGAGVGPDLQDALVGRDDTESVAAISDTLAAYGTDLETEWSVFARWNLATGTRAGAAEGYPFAAEVRGIEAEAEGSAIVDDNRFYPLAATYFRLDHPGGELFFATAEDPLGLIFSLHPVADGGSDGPVIDSVETFSPQSAELRSLGEQDAGGYWLVGTHPIAADQSVKIEFCLGLAEDVEGCVAEVEDTGGEGTTEPEGCGGCSGSGGGGALLAIFGLLGLTARRTTARVG
jgi:hypothetical protein